MYTNTNAYLCVVCGLIGRQVHNEELEAYAAAKENFQKAFFDRLGTLQRKVGLHGATHSCWRAACHLSPMRPLLVYIFLAVN
jgi:hypothetical protein